jgi:hypothetical protein
VHTQPQDVVCVVGNLPAKPVFSPVQIRVPPPPETQAYQGFPAFFMPQKCGLKNVKIYATATKQQPKKKLTLNVS